MKKKVLFYVIYVLAIIVTAIAVIKIAIPFQDWVTTEPTDRIGVAIDSVTEAIPEGTWESADKNLKLVVTPEYAELYVNGEQREIYYSDWASQMWYTKSTDKGFREICQEYTDFSPWTYNIYTFSGEYDIIENNEIVDWEQYELYIFRKRTILGLGKNVKEVVVTRINSTEYLNDEDYKFAHTTLYRVSD